MRYQKRLQEIINARPTQNKYFDIKRPAAKDDDVEEIEGENGAEKNSEIALLKDRVNSVAQELSNKTLDVCYHVETAS